MVLFIHFFVQIYTRTAFWQLFLYVPELGDEKTLVICNEFEQHHPVVLVNQQRSNPHEHNTPNTIPLFYYRSCTREIIKESQCSGVVFEWIGLLPIYWHNGMVLPK